MPIGAYFKGSGGSVMSKLKNEYGDKGGESTFYALANKRPSMKPEGEKAPRKASGKPDLLAGARRVLSGRGR